MQDGTKTRALAGSQPLSGFIFTEPRPALKTDPIGGWPKRYFDLTAALLGLILLLPLLLGLALVVRCLLGSPVLFRHRRIGRHGTEFDCLKFRTMINDDGSLLRKTIAESPELRAEWEASRKLRNDPRITPLGRVLRQTSLDELPQLINVLKGDMSLVGPRPIVQDEVPKYGEHIHEYYRARPGLTGLWQISGRNDVSYDLRVNLDRKYVTEYSIRQDIKILILTLPAILTSRGCY